MNYKTRNGIIGFIFGVGIITLNAFVEYDNRIITAGFAMAVAATLGIFVGTLSASSSKEEI